MTNNYVLSELIELSRDGEWGKSEPFDGSVKMAAIRGTDFDAVRQGEVDLVPSRFIKEHIAEYKNLHGGEIVIEAAGGSIGKITGRTIYLKPETVARFGIPVTCASFSRFIRLKHSKLWDTRYIFWLLQYLYHFGFMSKYHTQHTGVSRFQWTVFSENEVLTLPPLLTQRKIAAILSAYDDLIENNLRRIKILEEMAQNIYSEWFVKFRFPGHQHTRFIDSSLDRIPEGWEVVKAGETLKKVKRGTKIQKKDYATEGSIPIVDQGKEFLGGYTDNTESLISDDLPLIVFGDHTRILKFIDFPFACGADGTQLLKSNNERMPMTLFYYALSSIDISDFAYARHFKFLKEEPLVLPERSIADLFDQFVTPLREQTRSLMQKNTILRRTRDLLLPKLISGEVDLSELDIVVPEEARA